MAYKFTAYKAEDGTIHETREAAVEHEHEMAFYAWCREHICGGGTWSASMVAAAVLAGWSVTRKHPEAIPPGPPIRRKTVELADLELALKMVSICTSGQLLTHEERAAAVWENLP